MMTTINTHGWSTTRVPPPPQEEQDFVVVPAAAAAAKCWMKNVVVVNNMHKKTILCVLSAIGGAKFSAQLGLKVKRKNNNNSAVR
jgi:hypothetical protein